MARPFAVLKFSCNALLPPDLFTPTLKLPAGLRFRLAVPDDCRPLHAACYPEQAFTRFREQFRRLLSWQANGRCYWLVVETVAAEPSLLGSGQLVIYPHGAELANLSVTANHQNQGIGTALIELLIRLARRVSVEHLEIAVATDNPRALALYQRLGFSEDRRLKLPGGKQAIILCQTL